MTVPSGRAGQFYLAAQEKQPNGSPYHLPRARAVCDQSPWDECCFSCAQSGPKNDDGTLKCPADPTCEGPDGQTAMLSDAEESRFSLRCFDQKRRFGIDFPLSPRIATRDGAAIAHGDRPERGGGAESPLCGISIPGTRSPAFARRTWCSSWG